MFKLTLVSFLILFCFKVLALESKNTEHSDIITKLRYFSNLQLEISQVGLSKNEKYTARQKLNSSEDAITDLVHDVACVISNTPNKELIDNYLYFLVVFYNSASEDIWETLAPLIIQVEMVRESILVLPIESKIKLKKVFEFGFLSLSKDLKKGQDINEFNHIFK